jgi:hypothetical protein
LSANVLLCFTIPSLSLLSSDYKKEFADLNSLFSSLLSRDMILND